MAIRWDNVSGPSVAQAASSLGDAQKTFSGMFSGIDDILKKREAMETANWDQGKLSNTNAFLNATQEAKTPEEFAAREAMLREQLKGYGAQIDPMAARAALDGRMSTLQQRSLANQQYTDQQTEVANRPVAAGYQGALAQATTPEGVRGLMESMQAAVGAGAIDPRIFAKVMQQAQTRNTGLVGDAQRAETHIRQGLDLDSNIAHRANQDAVAKVKAENDRQQLVVSQQRLSEDRAARVAAAGNANINARSGLLKNAGDLIKEQTAATKEIEKSTPYAAVYGGANVEEVRKLAEKLNSDDPKYGNAVVTKLAGMSKEFKNGIPVDVINSAMSMAKDEFGASLWRSDGYSNSVQDHVRTLMKDPDVISRAAFAAEIMGKARGQYNGAAPEPVKADPAKPDLPKPAATPGINDRPLPPKLQPPPPEVSKSGSLVYASPETFNISSNKGVMLPAKMPLGKMEAVIKDGDTIAVTGDNGVAMNFRFNGLDAQETGKTKDGKTTQGQKYSEDAKAFITEAFKKGKVDIKVASNKPDSYGRHVADVYVNGESLNEALLRRGLATVLKVAGGIGPSQNAAFTRIQEQAMRDNVGIMGDMASDRSPTGAAYRMFGDNLYK